MVLRPVAVGGPRPIPPHLGAEPLRSLREVAPLAQEPLLEVLPQDRRTPQRLAQEPQVAQLRLGQGEGKVDPQDEPPLRPARLLEKPAGEAAGKVSPARRIGERPPEPD